MIKSNYSGYTSTCTKGDAMMLAMAYTDRPPTTEALKWVWKHVRIIAVGDLTYDAGVGESIEDNEEVVKILEQRWGMTRQQMVEKCWRLEDVCGT